MEDATYTEHSKEEAERMGAFEDDSMTEAEAAESFVGLTEDGSVSNEVEK